MPPRSRQPGPGQEPLPDMPEQPQQPAVVEQAQRSDPEKRRAFGSVPRLLGSKALELAVEYHEISPELIMEVGANNLRTSLTSPRGKFMVAGLALNETEFKHIIRSKELETVEAPVMARTVAANRGTVNPIRLEEKELKSRKGLLGTKGKAHTAVLNSLEKENVNLSELFRLIKSPGFALVKEADLRILATSAWEHSFLNLINVAKNQFGWDNDKAEQAKKAMTSRLLSGPQRERVRYWEELTGLARDYSRMKHALFSQRKNKIVTSYLKVDKELTEFYEKNGLQPVT